MSFRTKMKIIRPRKTFMRLCAQDQCQTAKMDDGDNWQLKINTLDNGWSLNTVQGRLEYAQVNTEGCFVFLPFGWDRGNVDIKVRMRCPAEEDGWPGICFRASEGSESAFAAFYRYRGDQNDQIHFTHITNTGQDPAGFSTEQVTLGVSRSPDSKIWFRAQIEGEATSGGATARAKVWDVGSGEPSGWDIEGTSTNDEIPDVGGVGVFQGLAFSYTEIDYFKVCVL